MYEYKKTNRTSSKINKEFRLFLKQIVRVKYKVVLLSKHVYLVFVKVVLLPENEQNFQNFQQASAARIFTLSLWR
jgi:hypothetical protein